MKTGLLVLLILSASLGETEGRSLKNIEGKNEEEGATPPRVDKDPDHPHILNGIHIAFFDFELVEAPFYIALWVFAATLAKVGFHLAPRLSRLFPESCLLIVMGLLVGGILYLAGDTSWTLTPQTFFNLLLPPIILDAGYFMPNRLFFDNLGTILLMAVVGTFWNTVAIGLSLWGISVWWGFGGMKVPLLQCLLFSSLISAVDPVAVLAVFEEIHVNELLYIVVFGESLLNDAVTVALYEMFEEYAVMGPEKVTVAEIAKGFAKFPVVSLGGTAIGILSGLLIGFVTRFTHQSKVMEPLLVIVMAFLAYLTAEMFHLSGIMAATFCGLTMKNYIRANVSPKSLTTFKYSLKMLSSGCETIVFILLGLSTVTGNHEWNGPFIISTLVFCTVYRAIGTFTLCAIANHFRLNRIGGVDQFVIAYGGLRGAIAFALVLLISPAATLFDDKLRRMLISTTICVIYFTVFIQGMTIKPIVGWLNVARSEKRKPTMNERLHERLMECAMVGMERVAGHMGHYNLRAKLRHLDSRYLRPYLIREGAGGPEPKLLETYSKLLMQDVTTVMVNSKQHDEGMVAEARKRLNSIYPPTAGEPSPFGLSELLSKELRVPEEYVNRYVYNRHSLPDEDEDIAAVRSRKTSQLSEHSGGDNNMRGWDNPAFQTQIRSSDSRRRHSVCSSDIRSAGVGSPHQNPPTSAPHSRKGSIFLAMPPIILEPVMEGPTQVEQLLGPASHPKQE